MDLSSCVISGYSLGRLLGVGGGGGGRLISYRLLLFGIHLKTDILKTKTLVIFFELTKS